VKIYIYNTKRRTHKTTVERFSVAFQSVLMQEQHVVQSNFVDRWMDG